VVRYKEGTVACKRWIWARDNGLKSFPWKNPSCAKIPVRSALPRNFVGKFLQWFLRGTPDLKRPDTRRRGHRMDHWLRPWAYHGHGSSSCECVVPCLQRKNVVLGLGSFTGIGADRCATVMDTPLHRMRSHHKGRMARALCFGGAGTRRIWVAVATGGLG